MVSSIDYADSNAVQLAMAAMYQKLNAANTDGIAGLSKDELSSIDAGSDKGGSAFLKSLTDQFDQLDADGNGQLSGKEIASAKPKGQMGPPPGLEIGSTNSSSSSNSIDDIIKKLLKKLEDELDKVTGHDSSSKTASKSDFAPVASELAKADTDGTEGLSLDELSSIDTKNNSGKTNFINNLKTNFDKIDADGNGQLSQSEILASKPADSVTTANGASGGSNNIGNSLGSLSGSFFQKLISSYKNGNLSELASSLNMAV